MWRVEVVGGSDGTSVKTVTSKIKLHHYFMRCVLTSSGKQLPKWGFEQQEVSCNPTQRDPNSLWNVEDNFFPKCKLTKFLSMFVLSGHAEGSGLIDPSLSLAVCLGT